ncbi:unnamed protein product [Brassicogethes aeneus]|uniref:Uncharacterized protein n=1 Tax=Brassicogethes aeneus TaxID=1431903 RepID=A0A9P0FFY4_BRAAE|nr:unnamed protein product [Brassicogethes aeneus]
MKFIILCFAVVATVYAGVLTDEQRHKLLSFHNECAKETGVNEDLIGEAMMGNFSDDPTFKDQILCFSKKIGFLDASGKIDVETMKNKFKMMHDHDDEKIDEVVEKCGKDMDTPEDTAVELMKCLFEVKKEMKKN